MVEGEPCDSTISLIRCAQVTMDVCLKEKDGLMTEVQANLVNLSALRNVTL